MTEEDLSSSDGVGVAVATTRAAWQGSAGRSQAKRGGFRKPGGSVAFKSASERQLSAAEKC